MKKLFRNLSVLLLTVVAVLATGCYEQEVPFLAVDHEVVLVSPATGKGTVVVESNLDKWTASSDCEWIAVDNGFGNHKGTFEFFVEANTTPYERSGKIKLEGAGCAVTVLVRQQSEGTLLTLAADEIAFTKLAGEYQMAICCNNGWTAASSADWCKVDPTSGKGNGSFKISVDENTTGADRVATISIVTEADGKTQVSKVNVFQSASNDALVVSPESKQLTEAAEDFVIDLITVGNWSASVDSDWLTLGQTSGKGDAKVVVSASANETGAVRQTVITFATGKENENRVIRQVVVTQEAYDFYLELPIQNFPLSLAAQDIEIPYNLAGSNVTVSASSNVDWMKVTSVADGKALVAVNENKTSKAREGIIAFITNGQNGDPIIRQARVAQAPTINLLDVLASEYAIEWVGDVVLIPIYSNTPVSARSSESWCHVSVKDQDVVIAVDRNDTALPREAVVTVRTESESGDILSKTTIIRQAAAYSELVVSPATKMIFALAETFVGSIVTNNSWIASVDSPWLTIDKTEGVGDYMLTINAEANTTGQERVATITVETGIENSKRESATIVVTQVPEQFYFEIPGRDYALTKLEQDLQIPYQTSGNELEIVATTSDKWIHINGVDPETNMINLHVDENGTEFVRTGVISVSCTPQYGDPKVIDVTITQAPTVNILDIFVDNVDVMARGDTLSLPFYANVPVQITSSETWVHVGEYDYRVCCDGQQVVTIKVDPNRTAEARVAFVTLTNITPTGEKLTRVITVRQAALQASLEVTPKTVIKPSFASEFDIQILSTGTWSVTCDEAWITLSDAYGFSDGTVHVSMPVNDSGADRSATITIATGAENGEREIQKVSVTQLMKDTYLIIPEEAYALNLWEQPLNVGYYVAGELTDMQVNCSEDWITYDPANSDATTLAFKVKENDTKDVRTATVTVTATFLQGDPITDTFTVTQAPTVNILDVFVDKKFVSGKGETFTLPYYCNTIADLTSSVPWMTVSLDDANDPQAVNVTVDVNRTAESRKGYITITNINQKGEKLTKVIEVEQAPLQASLMVTPELKVLPAHDAEFVAGINCTGKWAVNCEVDWLTLSATSGEGDSTITVTAADNNTGEERVATITVTTDSENGVRVTKDIVVKQIPFDIYLEIPEDAYALNKYEQTLDVAYTKAGSIADFFVEVSEDWITFESEDGANLTFKVKENTTAEVRTATVTATVVPVKGEPITDTFTVTQAPTINILDIYQDYIAVLAEGEEVVLPLLTNTTIDAVVSNAAWVTATTANDRVTIVAAENETGLDRTATVTVTTTTDKGQTIKKVITVFQPAEGMYFDVITPLSYMLSKEEQVVPSIIYAATGADNNEINAESDSEWITLSGVDANGTICNVKFTIAENTTDQIRVGHVVVTYKDQKGETHEQTITYTQAATINTLDAFADYMVVVPEGETETVAIMTNDAAISAVASDTWLTATATTSLVTIEVTENTTGVDRQARVTISTTNTKGNMVKKVITVFQPAETAYFRLLTENEFNLSKEQQDIDAVVYAATGTDNGEIDQNTDVDWITLSAVNVQPNTCKITYTVSENTTGAARTGHINVTFKDQKGETFVEDITVNQAPTVNTLDALADYIVVAAAGETNIVPIQTNTTVSAVSSETWATVTADANGVTIVADPNDTGYAREATVTVTTTNTKGDVIKKVITVYQPAKDQYWDVLTPLSYMLSKEEQSVTTTVYAVNGADNNEVKANSDSDWITLASATASGTLCDVKFNIAENTTDQVREGHVVVTYKDQKGQVYEETITYTQAATINTLDAFADYMVVVPEGETETIAVLTNDSALSVSASDTWVHPTATTNLVTIVVDENKTGVDRQARVTVSTTNTKGNVVKKVITVFQPAEESYLALVTSDEFFLSKEQQNIDAIVYSATGTNNNEIDQNVDVAWIALSGVTPAANTCKITYTVSENTTGENRTGHINVTYKDQKGEDHVMTITVNQAATVNTLDALADYIAVAAAGETNIVPIQTNTTVSAASSETWATVSADANGVTIVAAENNTGLDREATVTVSTTNAKGNVVKKVITVFQPAKDQVFDVVSPLSNVLSKEGQTAKVVAYVATGATASNLTAASDCGWLTVPAVSASDKFGTFNVTVAENTTGEVRNGKVVVTFVDQKGETQEETVTFTQAATVNTLEAFADYIVLDPMGETEKVAVTTNDAALAAVASDTWITATPSTSYVSIAAGANDSGYDRQGIVTVSTTNTKGDKVSKAITVFQPAKTQSFGLISADTYYVSKASTTVNAVAYAYPGVDDITAVPSNSWIGVGMTSVSGNTMSIPLTAEANNTAEERTGTVVVSYTDQSHNVHSATITIIQAATVNTLDVLSDYIVVAAAGETQNFAIVSNGTVTVTENASWFTASEANGVVTVVATANATGYDREAVVVVETANANGNKVRKEVTVYQPAKDQFFELVTADNYNLDKNAVTTAIDVVAYVANGATTTNVTMKSNADWITLGSVSATGNTATAGFTVTENATTEVREGQIDVTYTDEKGEAHKAVVTVKQSGTDVSFDTLSEYVTLTPEAGASYSMVVVSGATINAVSSDPSWLTATVTPGTGISTVKISATQNTTGHDRTGRVTVYTTIGGKQFQKIINVVQLADDTFFELLSPDTYYVNNGWNTIYSTVYAYPDVNDVTITTNSNWISVGMTSVTGNTMSIPLTAEPNDTDAERTGSVVISYVDPTNAIHTATVTFVQGATVNTLDVLSDYIVVAAAGESKDFAFVSNGAVTLTENASWFTANQSNGVVTIAADANATGKDREAIVVVETANANGNKVKKQVTVFQPAADNYYGLLSADEYFFDNAANTVNVAFYASTGVTEAGVVTMTSDASWLTLGTETKNADSYTCPVAVSANTTGIARTGHLTLVYKDQKGEKHSYVITVNQAGEDVAFDATPEYLTLAPKGEAYTLVVESSNNIQQAVSSNTAWLTAGISNGKEITVTATENTTGQPRTGRVTLVTTIAGQQYQKVINVTQPAKDTQFMLISAASMAFTKLAQNFNVVAYSLGFTPVKAETVADWITIGTATVSDGVYTFPCSVEENKAAKAREAEITVYGVDAAGNAASATVTVAQSPTTNVLDVYTDKLTILQPGKTIDIPMYATVDSPIVKSNETWLTASLAVEDGVQFVRLVAPANTMEHERIAIVTIKATVAPGNVQVKTITVVQQGTLDTPIKLGDKFSISGSWFSGSTDL